MWADSGEALVVTPELAAPWPRPSCPAPGWAPIEAIERDQWTIYSTYRPHRRCCASPSMTPPAAWCMIRSSRSGEVVALTTRFERGWSWLGTVPHWFYFTPLRGDDTSLWRQLVLWAAASALAPADRAARFGQMVWMPSPALRSNKPRPSACAWRRYPRGQGHALPGA